MTTIEEPAPGYYWVWNREGPLYWSIAQRLEVDRKNPDRWRLLDCDGPFPGFETRYVLGPGIARLDEPVPDGTLAEAGASVPDDTISGFYWAWNRRTGAAAPAQLIEAYEKEPAEWYVFGCEKAYVGFEQDYVLGPAIPEPVERPPGADLPEAKRKSLRFVPAPGEGAHAADQPAPPDIVEDGAASGFWHAVARVLKLN